MNVSTPRWLTPEVSVAPHSHRKADVAKPYHYQESLLGSRSLLPLICAGKTPPLDGKSPSRRWPASVWCSRWLRQAGTLRKWQKRLLRSCAEVSFLSPASPRRGFVCVGLGACVHVRLPPWDWNLPSREAEVGFCCMAGFVFNILLFFYPSWIISLSQFPPVSNPKAPTYRFGKEWGKPGWTFKEVKQKKNDFTALTGLVNLSLGLSTLKLNFPVRMQSVGRGLAYPWFWSPVSSKTLCGGTHLQPLCSEGWEIQGCQAQWCMP